MFLGCLFQDRFLIVLGSVLGSIWEPFGLPNGVYVEGFGGSGLGSILGWFPGEPGSEATRGGGGKKADPWGLLETNNLTAGICKTRNWRLKAYKLGRNCKERCLEATPHSLVAPKGPADCILAAGGVCSTAGDFNFPMGGFKLKVYGLDRVHT